MTVIATALKHLIAAGISGDDLVRAVADMEAATDTRSTGAKRTARWRERHKASQSVTPVTSDADAIPPNDIYSNPPISPEGAKAPCPPALSEKVVEAWNAGPAASGATRATKLDAGRRKALAVRVREHGEDAVFAAIRNLGGSEFHCGKNDRSWRVNLGWMLKSPENFLKALEMAGRGGGEDRPTMDEAARKAYLAKLEAGSFAATAPRPEPSARPKQYGGGPKPFGDLALRAASP